MPEAMKKPHTKKEKRISIRVGDKNTKLYLVPEKKAKAVAAIIAEYENEETIPWREVMADLLEETSQQAIVLKSYRKEKKLSQIKLAEILDVDQSLISKIECGEKEISKSLAKKLGKTFDIDYRVFL